MDEKKLDDVIEEVYEEETEVDNKSFDDVESEDAVETKPIDDVDINSTIKESIDHIIDAVKDIKMTENQKQKPKEFKIGFFGYLTIAVLIKGIVSIIKALCDRRK